MASALPGIFPPRTASRPRDNLLLVVILSCCARAQVDCNIARGAPQEIHRQRIAERSQRERIALMEITRAKAHVLAGVSESPASPSHGHRGRNPVAAEPATREEPCETGAGTRRCRAPKRMHASTTQYKRTDFQFHYPPPPPTPRTPHIQRADTTAWRRRTLLSRVAGRRRAAVLRRGKSPRERAATSGDTRGGRKCDAEAEVEKMGMG